VEDVAGLQKQITVSPITRTMTRCKVRQYMDNSLDKQKSLYSRYILVGAPIHDLSILIIMTA
jgi:hypothetical protein